MPLDPTAWVMQTNMQRGKYIIDSYELYMYTELLLCMTIGHRLIGYYSV